jgi:hypothetical protein
VCGERGERKCGEGRRSRAYRLSSDKWAQILPFTIHDFVRVVNRRVDIAVVVTTPRVDDRDEPTHRTAQESLQERRKHPVTSTRAKGVPNVASAQRPTECIPQTDDCARERRDCP